MKYLVSSAEMQDYDRNTIEKIGIPALVLMERAALQAFERCRVQLESTPMEARTALILAGVGNNGGDGLALARLLAETGVAVEIWCVGDEEKATEQWKVQKEILKHYSVRYSPKPTRDEYTIVVDALFGIGLSREITGSRQEAVERFRRLRGWKLALDIPSGVDADSGRIWGCCVSVDETVTFGFCKRGLVLYPGCEAAGRVLTVPIGISGKAFFGREPEWFSYDETVTELLPVRDRAGNKGTFGKVLVIAGSRNMAGAALLAARAAYRAGAGMVKLVTAAENRVVVQQALPEALLATEEEVSAALGDWADVVVVGPGIGRDERAGRLLEQTLDAGDLPTVIDADALNLLAESDRLRSKLAKQGSRGRGIVLTPHMGELARLTGKPIPELKENPSGYAGELARQLHAVVVAKDARTFICRKKGSCCVNLTGNSGMATAGSGDVLAGIIGGLLAQGESPFRAACVGAYLHGRAGDAAAEMLGEHGCMAGDIIEALTAETAVGKQPDTGKCTGQEAGIWEWEK